MASNNHPEILRFSDNNHAWNQVELNGEWYNLDVTWFSINKNIKEEEKLKYVLVDDDTFKYHYETGTYEMFKCNKLYNNRQELYNKVKNIKNVLEEYDLGKRDTILQYNLENIWIVNTFLYNFYKDIFLYSTGVK